MSKIPKDIKDLLFYIELQQKQAQTNKKFFKEGTQNYKHWEIGKQFILKCYLQLVFILT